MLTLPLRAYLAPVNIPRRQSRTAYRQGMSDWREDALRRLGDAEEVRITSVRSDGSSRQAVTTWVVRHGNGLYLRSVRGKDGHWYRGAMERHEGRITTSGLHQDVTFVETGDELGHEIDAAFRAKYKRYAGRILDSVLTPQAQASTLRLVPRP